MKLKIKEILKITENDNLNIIRNTYVRETKVSFICKQCGRNYQGILRYLPDNLICKQCNIDKTKIERYGSKTYNNSSQNKITNLLKYGVESWAQTDEGRKKLAESAKSEKHRQAVINGFKKRTPEDWKKTQLLKEQHIIEKYGSLDTYYKMMQKIKENACLKKYGIKNAGALNAEKPYKYWNKFKYDNYSFDSSWELVYYIWLKEHNIEFEYHNGYYFEYYDDKNNKHRYYPDFYVNGKYIEIKSDFLWDFKNNKLKNQDGTINEAKTKCLLDNNIIILFKNDIKPYLKYVIDKYGKNFLKLDKICKYNFNRK